MTRLVVIKNPFEPWNGRELKDIEAGITAKELKEQYKIEGVDLIVAVNGSEVEDNYVTKEEDFVVISPLIGKSGKNILGLILSIGLAIVSFGIVSSGWLASSGFWAAGHLGAYIAATAVMFLGNMLVGRLMGQSVDTGPYGDSNPTYSWGEIQTMQGQNNPIALTYGTVISGGQTIGKFVNTLDNDEYLNWLVAAGEGVLEITDIKLNDNDISYFKGTEVEIRSGTNVEEVISNFNDTYFTKNMDYQLTDVERIDTAQGNGTEGLIVRVEFPSGLYYANDSGGLSKAWVKLLGYYRQGTDGEWIPFIYTKVTSNQYIKSVNQDATMGTYHLYVYDTTNTSEPDYPVTTTTAQITYPDTTVLSTTITRGTEFTLGYFKVLIPAPEEGESAPTINEDFVVASEGVKITGSQSSALRKEYRVDSLTAGEYYVKMAVTERSHNVTNSRASVRCYWTALTSIVYDDFCYPNIALIGIKALATDQINGSPTLKFTKTKSVIYAWNPNTEQYEQKDAKNVAWACYDILHLCRYLEHPVTHEWEYDVQGIKAERILYDQFDEWAEFCEEEGFYVNIEINQLGEMLDVINQKIAPIGHGKVLRLGTRYGCTWDCAKQPVQMFGMGNIIAGTFNEQFLPTNDRANAVELTYMDADNNFNRETITIMADDYDSAVETKTAQATYDGITNYEQAYREGKYQLFCNKYRLRTVSFEASVDSINCTIGDVVLVAHDVPKWAKSGRIYEVQDDELVLPVELGDATQNYRFMYRTINDNIYTTNCEILNNKDGWCKIKIDSYNESDPPQANDIFDIAVSTVGSKPFIIRNISRAKDFKRKIDCIEYDERVYNEDYNIPPIEYSEVDLRPKNVTNLVARSFHYLTGVHVDVSWQQASNGTFNLFFFDGENWNLVVNDLKTNQYSADVEYDVVQVRVVTMSGVISSSGTIADVENIDNKVSALAIQNLTASVSMSGNVGTVTATWDSVVASNFKNYVITFRGSSYNTLNSAAEYGGVPEGTYTLTVRAKAIDGTYGAESSVTVVVEEETPTS